MSERFFCCPRGEAKRVLVCDRCAGRASAPQQAQETSLPPQGAEPDYSDMSREALERHAKRLWQAMVTAHAFWHKHALGPLAAPSCLCCGKLPDEVAIRHMELPGVVICKLCRDKALGASEAAPVGWADEVEQRLLTWRQRFVNKSGDQLALDDFMGQESIDDLIDFVCAPLAAAPSTTTDAAAKEAS